VEGLARGWGLEKIVREKPSWTRKRLGMIEGGVFTKKKPHRDGGGDGVFKVCGKWGSTCGEIKKSWT